MLRKAARQTPVVNYADLVKMREFSCRVKAEPLFCRVNGGSETDGYGSLGVAGGAGLRGVWYRGTSLIRNRHPLGPYSRTMPMAS